MRRAACPCGPDRAVESFAGVGNPFSLRAPEVGECVVDLGSNGVINLCADKGAVFAEAYRVLRPGGVLQFADIANGKPLPEAAVCEIDLWTGCIAGGLPVDDWCAALDRAGFVNLSVGLAVDACGGSRGEPNARAYDVAAHVFLARRAT